MKKYILGFLMLVILTSSVYVMLPDKVKVVVEPTKTKFYVYEDSWVLAGTEYVNLFDGTRKMRAKNRSIDYIIYPDNRTNITRIANYKEGIVTVETYLFDGRTEDVELIPVFHNIKILNGEGKILQYQVKDLLYTGKTIKNIESPQSFGHNMKIEWDSGNYYSRIYKYKYRNEGKLTVRYRIDSEDYSKNARFFDPVSGITDRIEWFLGPDNNGRDTVDDLWTAQTFTIGTEGADQNYNVNLTSFFTDSSVTPKMTIRITDVNGSQHPINLDDPYSIGTSGAAVTSGWNNISLTSLKTLQRSTEYAMVMNNTAATVTWRHREITANYSGGTLVGSSDGGANWATLTRDNLFEIWGPASLTGPTITLNAPVDNFNSTSNTVLFNTTVFDDLNLINVNLSGNWSGGWHVNQTNNTGVNNSDYLFTNFIDDGYYLWGIQAVDNDSQITNSVNRTFLVDGKPPEVAYNPTTEANNSFLSRNYALVNISAFDFSLDSVMLDWNGTNETFQTTADNNSWSNKTGLSDGNYTFYGWANSTLGNFNATLRRTIIIDTIIPFIDYSSETPANQSALTDSLFINVSISEINPFNITFILYNSTNLVNQTTLLMGNQSSNTTINFTNLPEDVYFYNVSTWDIRGHKNNTLTRQAFITTFSLLLEGLAVNAIAELNTSILITANSTTPGVTICIDIDHPDFGINNTCELNTSIYNISANYFRTKTFSDLNTKADLYFLNYSIFNLTFSSHKYDEADSLRINLTGGVNNASDIAFYHANTTPDASNSSDLVRHTDRFYQGILTGENIYLNHLWDSPSTLNLSYGVGGGEQLIFVILDDILRGTVVYDFSFNVVGSIFGISFTDGEDSVAIEGFANYSRIAEGETTAQLLNNSGPILPKNLSQAEYFLDDFEDDSVDSNIWTESFRSESEDCSTADNLRCVDESGGDLRIRTAAGTAAANINWANATTINLRRSESDMVNLSIVNDYDCDESANPCFGETEIYFDGNLIWSLPTLDASAGGSETGDANLNFIFRRINKSHWSQQIYGTVDLTATGQSNVNQVYLGNYTAIEAKIDSLEFLTKCQEINGGDCINNNLLVSFVNRTLWTRQSSDVYSDIIYQSNGSIIQADMWVSFELPGFVGGNVQERTLFYLSADNGTNWELAGGAANFTSSLAYPSNSKLSAFSLGRTLFTNPGNHLRWRVSFVINPGDDLNFTSKIYEINVSVPKGNPTNLSFDFGDDGTTDFTIGGELTTANGSITVNLSQVNISTAFSNLTIFSAFNYTYDHAYKIPISITSATIGELGIDNINLTYNPNPVLLNASFIQEVLFNSTNFTVFRIPISAGNDTGSTNGTVGLNDIGYDYAGGKSIINILLHDVSYFLNVSFNLTYYYSRWDFSITPKSVNFLEFIPNSPTQKNVTPFGQTSNTPILNLSNYGYARSADLSAILNTSSACINHTVSLDSNKSHGQVLNESWINLSLSSDYLNTTNVWLWADYACGGQPNWTLYNPFFYFRQCSINSYCSPEVS